MFSNYLNNLIVINRTTTRFIQQLDSKRFQKFAIHEYRRKISGRKVVHSGKKNRIIKPKHPSLRPESKIFKKNSLTNFNVPNNNIFKTINTLGSI